MSAPVTVVDAIARHCLAVTAAPTITLAVLDIRRGFEAELG